MLKLGGTFYAEHWYRGVLVARHRFPNGITNAAIDDLLDTHFRSGTPPTNWYMGLIDNSSFSALSDADTMSSHSGWIENEDYDEATRPEWAPPASSSQKLINTTSVQFTMNTAVAIRGIFIASDNTKGGTSGLLWSHGLLSAVDNVQVGSVWKGFYSLTGRDG